MNRSEDWGNPSESQIARRVQFLVLVCGFSGAEVIAMFPQELPEEIRNLIRELTDRPLRSSPEELVHKWRKNFERRFKAAKVPWDAIDAVAPQPWYEFDALQEEPSGSSMFSPARVLFIKEATLMSPFEIQQLLPWSRENIDRVLDPLFRRPPIPESRFAHWQARLRAKLCAGTIPWTAIDVIVPPTHPRTAKQRMEKFVAKWN